MVLAALCHNAGANDILGDHQDIISHRDVCESLLNIAHNPGEQSQPHSLRSWHHPQTAFAQLSWHPLDCNLRTGRKGRCSQGFPTARWTFPPGGGGGGSWRPSAASLPNPFLPSPSPWYRLFLVHVSPAPRPLKALRWCAAPTTAKAQPRCWLQGLQSPRPCTPKMTSPTTTAAAST